MAALLRRFTTALPNTVGAVRDVLEGRLRETEPLEPEIELTSFLAAVKGVGSLSGTDIDRRLLEGVHGALRLSRRDAADPRVWQWLALQAAPELVWQRWWGATTPPPDWQESFTLSRAKRFGCSASLNGVSRNTFARLWWVAEAFEGDYDAARAAISNQDLFQAVFERRLGLYPPAARACFAELSGLPEGAMRDAAARLQFILGTTVLEALDEAAIRAILREQIDAGPRRSRGGTSAGRSQVMRRDDGTEIDAHFHVESVDGRAVIRYQSSGGREGGPNPRNLDYQEGLRLLLRRLGDLGSTLVEVSVDSEPMRLRPPSERLVQFDDGVLPLVLSEATDAEALRKLIVTRARKVGQDDTKKARSGGSSRALALTVSVNGAEPDAELQGRLSGPQAPGG